MMISSVSVKMEEHGGENYILMGGCVCGSLSVSCTLPYAEMCLRVPLSLEKAVRHD